MNEENLADLKKKVFEYYVSVGKVNCPYFQDVVIFDAGGFNHLIFKGSIRGRKRTKREQFIRLSLFKLAVLLLKKTTTVQKISKTHKWILNKRNKRKEKLLQLVYYWSFMAVMNDKVISVIVRQIGEGEKHFWSVIPKW